jgi:hypothetical protein
MCVVQCIIVSIRHICGAHVDPGEPIEIRMSLVRYSCVVKFICDLGSGVRDRIPLGARFCAPVHTGPVVQSASCTMGTGSFPGVKRLAHGVNRQPPSTVKFKKEYSPSDLSWPVLGRTSHFTFHLGCADG